MNAEILSLNVGEPQWMEWSGRKAFSSMHKRPVPGPLDVSLTAIVGDRFAEPEYHGTPDSVLYAYGMPSALEFMQSLGRDAYVPGSAGENLTVSQLDEHQVNVGDIFRIGEVEVQATFPRIPCGKLVLRFAHLEGQKAMQRTLRSGVYFRVLKAGRIYASDRMQLVTPSPVPFAISEAFAIHLKNSKSWPEVALQRVRDNGAFPARIVKMLRA